MYYINQKYFKNWFIIGYIGKKYLLKTCPEIRYCISCNVQLFIVHTLELRCRFTRLNFNKQYFSFKYLVLVQRLGVVVNLVLKIYCSKKVTFSLDKSSLSLFSFSPTTFNNAGIEGEVAISDDFVFPFTQPLHPRSNSSIRRNNSFFSYSSVCLASVVRTRFCLSWPTVASCSFSRA